MQYMFHSLEDETFQRDFAFKVLEIYEKLRNSFDPYVFAKELIELFGQDFVDKSKIELNPHINMGNFDAKTWIINVDIEQIADKKISDKNKVALIVKTMIHEVRHAEQYFRVGIFLNQYSKTDPKVELGIPWDIFVKLSNLAKTQKDEVAEKWYEILGKNKYENYKGLTNSLYEELQKLILCINLDNFFALLRGFDVEFGKILNNLNNLSQKTIFEKEIEQNVEYLIEKIENLDDFRKYHQNDTDYDAIMQNWFTELYEKLNDIYLNFPHEKDAKDIENQVRRIFLPLIRNS